MKAKLLILALTVIFAVPAEAYTPRSKTAKAEFLRANACPATGLHALPCHGWVRDHKIPICSGGADISRNLQWSTVADSKAKDKEEYALCAQVRAGKIKKSQSRAKTCVAAQREGWPGIAQAVCAKA